MTTEDYVSFETAKLLKNKGFDVPSYKPEEWLFCMYDEEGKLRWGCYSDDWYCRVTIQMAMKWLREKHIVIVPEVETFHAEGSVSSWEYHIWCGDNYEEGQNSFSSYEEACEAAIRHCLENLI